MPRLLGIAPVAIAFWSSTAVQADPMLGVGLTIGFGGGQTQVGVSGTVWHDDEEDSLVAGLGGTYYPGANRFGAHVAAGYAGDDYVLGGGYDVLNGTPIALLAYADTRSDERERSAEGAGDATDGTDPGGGVTTLILGGGGITIPEGVVTGGAVGAAGGAPIDDILR